ncbi:hypothetical protein Rhe02_68450 [Rhizocola hellebori]|uniref:Adenosylcobinamide kinase n=1 Tax=Rhizocola hellebori TaxID=1392758 RepID=A0A8J3QDA9_9ACTN|nr:bifunctional adenosylcobinamide kinase/adenosylcobinamide-phosphate guanylyltransferase [Rhizocola hellebori]GIH08778.1 hypothetical protein Rhe02_68450 [Rhizocola hellebori]
MAGGKILILGGIRSGKSEYAESLVAQAQQVRYIASAAHSDDSAFAERVEAHRFRRPASWETVETGADPALLLESLGKADPQWPVLVDDLGGWAATILGRADASVFVSQLVDAIRSCQASLILVSPEVGLSVVPPTAAGVAFADLLGELNQAVAAVCDEVTLIIAGQPSRLKPPPPVPAPAASRPPAVTGVAAGVATRKAAPLPDASVPPPIAAPTILTPSLAATAGLAGGAASAITSEAGQGSQPEPSLQSGQAGTAGQSDQPEPAGQSDQAATAGQSGQAAAAGQGGQPEPAGQSDQAGPAGQAEVEGSGGQLGAAQGDQPWVTPDGMADDAGAAVVVQPPGDVLRESTQVLSIVQLGVDIRPGMDLPIHDDEARTAAEAHLSTLEIPGSGLGSLARVVVFAAGTQGRGVPVTWRKPQMFLLNGIHEGNIAAGDDVRASAAVAEAARRGEGPIGLLATENGVAVKVVETPTSGDIAYGEASPRELITDQLREGWRLTDEAVDGGADLIIIGSCGAGAEATAATVTAKITGGEVAALLGRIVGPDGTVDDSSWMLRAATARDALHRSRNCDLNADTILAELGGADFAVIAGIILGATARRTPVLLDGPVGTAAALLARDLGSQSRLWSSIADYGSNPTTKAAADVLGLNPLVDLKAGLGEGATALVALPMLRAALTLASSLPARPKPTPAPPGFDDFVG